MKTKTYFAFRVDVWDDTGDSIVEALRLGRASLPCLTPGENPIN
jgi:hypothetical protein